MEEKKSIFSGLIHVILWIVRIWCLLMVSLIVIFFLGEEVFNDTKEFHVPVLSLITGILMLGGLMVAWKWQIIGGIISLLGFIGIQVINVGNSRTPLMYVLFALPAVLYILCGVIRHYLPSEAETGD